jgi:hypothetical protein
MGTTTLKVVRRWKAVLHGLSDLDLSPPAWRILTCYFRDDARELRPSHVEANGQAATMFRAGSEMDTAAEARGEASGGD